MRHPLLRLGLVNALLTAALAAALAAALVILPPPARAGDGAGALPLLAQPEALLDLAVLRAAYPGAIHGLEQGPAGRLDLVLTSGQRLPYDDGRIADGRMEDGRMDGGRMADGRVEGDRMDDASQALENPDIRTMLAQVYPLGPVDAVLARLEPGFDPGRARAQALFTALYGASEAAVRANCEAVRFDGKAVAFNVRHGAAQALMRVWGRIAALLPRHPEWGAVLRPLGGTLAWRRIAGTTRLSMHSFGIALDLNPHLPYWRTFPGEEGDLEAITRRRSGFPPEILAAFEAEGFIWGGKWASFDLMHFEYRPEMLLKARVLAGQVSLP